MSVQNGKTWHEEQKEELTIGQKAADAVAKFAGSWAYIIGISVFIVLYVGWNALLLHLVSSKGIAFDKYPFILLNLVLGVFVLLMQSFLLLSQNRQEERDKKKAERDYANDERALKIVEKLDIMLASIESNKLDMMADELDKIVEAVCKEPAKKPAKKPTKKKK